MRDVSVEITARTERTEVESRRIVAEYARRRRELAGDRYAPWQASEQLLLAERRFLGARLLYEQQVFPGPGDRCLEIGFGSIGWLAELIGWGVRETELSGIELDEYRACQVKAALPAADLRVGDAAALPWQDGTFKLVVASTVFTSILDEVVRQCVAAEIVRVMQPGGALLWYDFAVNNPRNPNVRKVNRKQLASLFPTLRGRAKSATLAPPLARWLAPRSWLMATVLQSVPLLRTHLIAVLVKPN